MLKLSKKIIAPFLSYSIFLRGLFFMPHPVCTLWSMVSKAADRSRRQRHEIWREPIALI